MADTPEDLEELIAELHDASKKLNVRQRLQGWAKALRTLPKKHINDFKWLLLVLNTAKNTIAVTGYESRREASKAVSQIEKSKTKDLDAVLVWVKSVKALRAAYPNYYADTKEFVDALSMALAIRP